MATTHAPVSHVTRLNKMLTDIDDRLARMRASLVDLEDSGSDVGADDDEGGGEADSTGVERDRLKAAIASDTEARYEATRALSRAETAAWGTCASCAGDIGVDRLEAIPTTDVCVTCKAAVW